MNPDSGRMHKDNPLRERVAALCHEQWSHWMKYLFSKCRSTSGLYINAGGPEAIIPDWAVERWLRQMRTPYAELSEQEKESDRKEADKFIDLFVERP